MYIHLKMLLVYCFLIGEGVGDSNIHVWQINIYLYRINDHRIPNVISEPNIKRIK